MEIVNKAMDKHFTPRRKSLEGARVYFADALHTHALGPELAAVRALSSRWFNWDDKITIDAEGFGPRHRSGPSWEFALSCEKPIPTWVGDIFKVTVDHPLWDNLQAIKTEHAALEASEEEMKAMLYGIVNSVFSVEKLAERWPAGREFFDPVSKVKMVAVVDTKLIDTVNRMLGLK